MHAKHVSCEDCHSRPQLLTFIDHKTLYVLPNEFVILNARSWSREGNRLRVETPRGNSIMYIKYHSQHTANFGVLRYLRIFLFSPAFVQLLACVSFVLLFRYFLILWKFLVAGCLVVPLLSIFKTKYKALYPSSLACHYSSSILTSLRALLIYSLYRIQPGIAVCFCDLKRFLELSE